MKGKKQVHSSAKTGGRDDWCTPTRLFENLNKEFNFNLDAAASEENSRCEFYIDEQQDALKQDWWATDMSIWLNPPYSKCKEFLKKVVDHAEWNKIVCLVPARTDTLWWHEYVMPYAVEVRFIKGRLKFAGAENGAPFPSVIIVYNGLRAAHESLKVSAINVRGEKL